MFLMVTSKKSILWPSLKTGSASYLAPVTGLPEYGKLVMGLARF
jgi:hypothetical protein